MMVGAILYDAFFVFGTTLMNPVAWSIPQFIQYPTQTGVEMLGGGDIALPGIVLAYFYRYDLKHPSRPKVFFYANLIAYIVALDVCGIVMLYFRASQPALIYIFPSFFITTLGCCYYTKEFII